MPKELYLNLQLAQVGAQLVRGLVVNDRHTQSAWGLEIERPVVNEQAFLRTSLGDREGDAKDPFLGLARMDVAGAEEDLKTAAQMEGFDAVLIQLERLVVDGADEVAVRCGALLENRANRGKFLRLREHESSELLTGEFARAVEKRSVQVFVQGKLAGVECREGKFVAILKIFPVQVEGFARFLAGVAVPAVSQNDTANVPKQRCDTRHESFLRATGSNGSRGILLHSRRE